MDEKLRITVALAALRHKPPTQSFEAYILDLQAAFTIACTTHRPCLSISQLQPSEEPWRDRVLELEREVEELRAQHEQEKLELLALRKAAQLQLTRPTADDGHATDSSAPVPTGKKAKGKKTKAQNAAVATYLPVRMPTLVTASAAGPKVSLSAMLRNSFPDTHLIPGSSPRIMNALDAADALIELLAADPTSASADLVVSTTLRAFKAVSVVFSRLVARYENLSGAGSSNAEVDSGVALHDSAGTLDTLVALLCTLVSAVVRAMGAQHIVATRHAKKKASKSSIQAARADAAATLAALDDVLGGVYELVLIPAVRAFVPLSAGYIAACLDTGSSATGNDLPDLRPTVFALLERVLATLDTSLTGSGATPAPTSSSKKARPHGAVPAAIFGSDDVKSLLALECTRELHLLYLPPGENQSPGARPDSLSQAYSRSPDTHPALGSARTSASLAASSSSSRLHAARQGTAAAAVVTGLPHSRCAPPRAGANLGETAHMAASGPAGGAARGHVGGGDSVRAGAASGPDGKAKRGVRGEGEGEGKNGARARIARLARKDAGWWLCAALGRVLVSSPGPTSSAGESAGTWTATSTLSGLTGTAGSSTTGSAGGISTDIAHQAVYDALADLLRRTRTRPGSARRASSSLAPSPSPRGHSPEPSNHEQVPGPPGDLEAAAGSKPSVRAESTRAAEGDRHAHAGDAGARMDGRMSEIERGMLLAVLERAWLG
ncbi:hypothetical protein C2E23DRAFT_901161 [Lenzites betulinus]|nr:hypothetical protein C2E23DRAFT_901161 [Lenzites betulinus]